MTRSSRAAGFTLIELMIAVAIVAILAGIAYPLYVHRIREARRVDAKSLVLKAANREEQLYTRNNQYLSGMDTLGLANGAVAVTENGAYQVKAEATGTHNQGYTITATAQGDQTNDACTQFQIDQTGHRTASANNCW